MSGFMRQLKQNNEQSFKSKFKQPIKYNQGSAVSLQSTIYNVNPQRCHGNNRLVNNTPNHPRAINKLHVPSCEYSCGPSSVVKRTNLSNRNLVDNRVLTRSELCCTKNIVKQYKSNDDLIDQLKSDNLKRNTLVKPISNDYCSVGSRCGYSHYTRADIIRQRQLDLQAGRTFDCDTCDGNRTLDQSMRQYKRCNTVKNINTLDSSEYIHLYRSNLVSNNNMPMPIENPTTNNRCIVTNCVNNCN